MSLSKKHMARGGRAKDGWWVFWRTNLHRAKRNGTEDAFSHALFSRRVNEKQTGPRCPPGLAMFRSEAEANLARLGIERSEDEEIVALRAAVSRLRAATAEPAEDPGEPPAVPSNLPKDTDAHHPEVQAWRAQRARHEEASERAEKWQKNREELAETEAKLEALLSSYDEAAKQMVSVGYSLQGAYLRGYHRRDALGRIEALPIALPDWVGASGLHEEIEEN